MPEISEKELTNLITELDYFKAKVSKLIETKPKKRKAKNHVRVQFEKDAYKIFGK
jgi:hypothetical protein